MTFVLAVELADGGRRDFTSGVPWQTGKAVVTRNGRTLSVGFVETSTRTVRFDDPPDMGDEIGFLVG